MPIDKASGSASFRPTPATTPAAATQPAGVASAQTPSTLAPSRSGSADLGDHLAELRLSGGSAAEPGRGTGGVSVRELAGKSAMPAKASEAPASGKAEAREAALADVARDGFHYANLSLELQARPEIKKAAAEAIARYSGEAYEPKVMRPGELEIRRKTDAFLATHPQLLADEGAALAAFKISDNFLQLMPPATQMACMMAWD